MKNLMKLADELIWALIDEGSFDDGKSKQLRGLINDWWESKLPREEIAKQWDDHYHYVDFRPDGWTAQHPLTERLTGSLMTCRINVDAEDWTYGSDPVTGEDKRPTGLFRAWPDPSWLCWAFEPVKESK